jgi:hypothetical protein
MRGFYKELNEVIKPRWSNDAWGIFLFYFIIYCLEVTWLVMDVCGTTSKANLSYTKKMGGDDTEQ